MPKYPFETEITAAAAKHGLNPDLIAAFCWRESRFKPEAYRYEPKFQRKYIDRHPNYEKLDYQTRHNLATSFGLMQVLGVTAHELGFPFLLLENLYKPECGLEYGCRKLKKLFERYGVHGSDNADLPTPNSLTDAISAYNAGTAKRGAKGGYVNNGYVVDVLMKYDKYRAQGERQG